MNRKLTTQFILLAILACYYCQAQRSDFIVTTTHDTMYVDKINVAEFEFKTVTAGKKRRFAFEDVVNYYLSAEDKHFERILLEKEEPKPVDRYDYKRNEDYYLEAYNNRNKYKYLERLTLGKIKLFTEVKMEGILVVGISASASSGVAARKNEMFYISILDSRLELLSDYSKLKLTQEVYDVLKVYLHGDAEITNQLDRLFATKPKADQDQIVQLINDYNRKTGSGK